MKFEKYQHIERFGTDEVEGIECGECYVFPKIDGTNSSLWMDDGKLCAGSRNRELSLDKDNAGFLEAIQSCDSIKSFFEEHPDVRLFGEWLVPHTIKTYREEAWRKFYVFDVMMENKYLHYNQYKLMLEKHGIEFIPPVCIVNDGTDVTFIKALEKNIYLIQDGLGVGEGVVVKRYDYVNKFGRQTWAKIVTSEFKERHTKTMGAPILEGELTAERKFIDDFCTEALVEKEYAKVALEGWSSKKIPQLLGVCFNALVTECTWEAVKRYKYPRIDYKLLNRLCVERIKKVKPEIFA